MAQFACIITSRVRAFARHYIVKWFIRSRRYFRIMFREVSIPIKCLNLKFFKLHITYILHFEKSLGLFICQSPSDFQISISFEKLRSFWIQICNAFFSKLIFRGRKFDLKFGVIPKEINVYQKYSILR